ncbi:PAS domain S-box protein [Ferribacterium limneticum]|uniref:PAS domain S-box protein n=1 Tax=Ferribacterium limneticum TaxID=76259 RepID=UPI001CFA8560|nr:PAS domain S-box protein [Ferribacterium limneticum]UCV29723.1 PAS domain S-box protein [Ferribacterium limneticum]UCV33642.1 PAS domain S-box protein [Ferribacterium limneticum]
MNPNSPSVAFLRVFLPAVLLILVGIWFWAEQGLSPWAFSVLLIGLAALGARQIVRGRRDERRAEQEFRAIFDHAMVGMARSDTAQRCLEVNPALCRILGRSNDELVGKAWPELTHPDDLAMSQANFERLMAGQSDGYSMEQRFLRADGSVVETHVSVRAIRSASGRNKSFAVVVQDISNWILAEREWEQSAKTLQRFIDHFPGTAYVKDADSRILIANRGFVRQLGLAPAAMIGRRSQDFFPGEFGEKILADDARIMASGQTEVIEESFGGRHYQSTKFVIPRGDGTADLGGITLDVTERRMAEQQLYQRDRRSAVFLELPIKAEALPEKDFMQYGLECAEELTGSAVAFIHLVNDDGNSIELVAWSRSTLEKYCTAAFDKHYPLAEAGIWADAVRQKMPVVVNDYAAAPGKHGLPEGHSVLLRFLSIPVMDGGAVRMVAGVGNKASDYTDYDVETLQLIANETWRIVRRQRIENALRLAMQVVNASPVVCFRWAASEGWPVVFVSENVKQWGYTPDDLKAGKPPFSELVHPDDLSRIADEVSRKTAAGLDGYEQEYRLLTAENQVIWVVDRTIVRRDAEGRALFYDGVLTNITERKTQQLAVSETLAQQKLLNKRLEEAHNQLLQSEKMASIGQLAAGVAHELNNPIGFVHSNLGTLDGYLHDLMAIIEAYDKLAGEMGTSFPALEKVLRLKDDCDFAFLKEDIFSLLSESKDGLGRVRKIVQDLKSFSRVGEQEWQEANLHQGIDSTLNIVWNELKYKCKVIKEYGDIPPVFCLISQLNQVFMNLLVNAGHAIENQGTITIRTYRRGDDAVCVEVSDSGVGIAPENLNRIFEPFYTTKPVGQGTGLGLSLAYSIIERHHGHLEVESSLGKGTTFRVILPVHQGKTAERESVETSL